MSLTQGDPPTLDPDDAPPSKQRYRLRTTREQRSAIRAIAAVSALLAMLSDAEPTGTTVADLALLAIFGGLVPLAASRARRWTLLILAGFVTALSRGWLLLVALAAVGSVAALVVADRRHRVIAAAAGAFAVQALLRLPDPGPDWLVPVLGGLAAALVLYSGYRHTHRRQRRAVRLLVFAASGLAVVATVLFAVALLTSRQDLEKGVDAARAGMVALKRGDTEVAADRLGAASTAFDSAGEVLDAPWALPARVVPVVSDYALATSEMAASGAELTASGAELSATASYDQLAPRRGRVDLELVDRLTGPAREAERALADAQATLAGLRTTWIVPPLAGALDDLVTEVDTTLPSARLAADGLEVAPALLGADGDRTYLIVLGQPAESRFLGGFAGSYGVLSAVDGQVDLVRNGPMSDLITAPGAARRTLSGPEEYLDRYGRYEPAQSLQNVTASPDFPTVASVFRELYPQVAGEPIDGVIYVDPLGLAELLRLTGPVDVPGYDVRLTADNAADLLLRDQYELFPGDRLREDFLSASLEATFDALTDRDLPAPRRIGNILGPAVDQGHLMVEAFEPHESDFLDLAGTRYPFPARDGHDFLSVRSSNNGQNKLDVYLQRRITYDIRVDPSTGVVEATATIRLENRLPSYELPDTVTGNRAQRDGRADAPPRGTNSQYVSVYSPLGLERASLDGRPASTEIQDELGHNVYSFLVDIAPGGSVTLQLDLVGAFDDLSGYELTVVPQPMVQPDQVVVEMRSDAPGSSVVGDGAERVEGGSRWEVPAMREPEDFVGTVVDRS